MIRVGHGATHSVWNPTALRWDYYRATAKPLRDGVIARTPRLAGGGRLGHTPEEATPRLPAGATKVGAGPIARGLVAKTGLGADGSSDTTRMLLLGLSAYLLYRYVLR